jgi:hypothetical protein
LDRHEENAIDPGADAPRAERSGSGDERLLRAKYLDWCSARLAERFLRLTPDEIYDLAQQASHEGGPRSGAAFVPDPGSAADPEVQPVASFRAIVERVTGVLAQTMALPSFEEWASAYRASPARYDEELLGFWKESL